MKRRNVNPIMWIGTALAVLVFAGASVAATAMNTDREITDAVEHEILLDGAVSLNALDISTADGIVTLTGSVENILAKERAARIASIVKGTRSVVNRIEVNPAPARKDSEIQRDIEQALLRDPATDSYQVDATVNDGTATLTGTVDSWQERELAEQVAKGQDGVRAIESEIEIDFKSERPDAEIKNEILAGLEWNALIDHALIAVDVDAGNVMLSGTVGSAAEKQQAYGEAWVAGATSVDSSGLEVARWARDDDLREDKYADREPSEIEGALEDAFLYDPRVMSFEIDTSVASGIATLRGTVDNLKAKRAAEQTAQNTVGVDAVRNFIRVRPESTLEDTFVEQRVTEAMKNDPYVNRYDVTVNVVDGTAYLYGQVDSFFERGQADDIAGRTAGVTEVRNNLTVADPADPYYTNPYVSPWTWYDYDWYDYTPTLTMRQDAEIKEDINDQIYWSPFVDSDTVNVAVEDGEAQLTGTVDSWSERAAATENAFEGGATWVDNDLIVQ